VLEGGMEEIKASSSGTIDIKVGVDVDVVMLKEGIYFKVG
jgi:hypothetical protein